MPLSLIVGARFNGKHSVQDAITCGVQPPRDWIWWRRITRRTQPTWREWETCWRSLSHTQAVSIPIHQGMRLLQHHGPKRLRKTWGWVAELLAQGHPLGDAMGAVFHLPPTWPPLLQTAVIQTSFLESLTIFCERQKYHQNQMRKNLRYPLVMSALIMVIGVVSTLGLVPSTPRVSTLPAWLPYVLWCLPLLGGGYMWRRLQYQQTPFFRFLELALKAGHTEHEAIAHYSRVAKDTSLQSVHQRLQSGDSLPQALKGIWPDAIVDLISLNTDRLDIIAGHIADMVEADEQEKTERWLAWTQAGLIIMMGAMVMWMAWTTLIPLYESLGQFSL